MIIVFIIWMGSTYRCLLSSSHVLSLSVLLYLGTGMLHLFPLSSSPLFESSPSVFEMFRVVWGVDRWAFETSHDFSHDTQSYDDQSTNQVFVACHFSGNLIRLEQDPSSMALYS